MTVLAEIRRRIPDGLLLGLLVVLVTAAERFDAGRAEIATYGEQVQAGWLPVGWTGVAIASAVIASLVGVRIVEAAGANGATPALPWLVVSALTAWLAWQVTGALVVYGIEVPEGLRTLCHLGAALLAIATVGWAGRAVAGDAPSAWERASVVRLQLILLFTLAALVLFVPITSDQCLDVLRAWGDGPYTRAAVGLAAGLLLGAVCRASSVRLLVPKGTVAKYHVRRATDAIASALGHGWALPPALAVALLLLLGWLPAAAALAAVTVMAAATKWDEALTPDTPTDRRSLRRLAGTLGVVPLGIVLAGLSSAALDSLLLPSPLSSSDATLLLYAGLALAGFSFLCADAHKRRASWMTRRRRRVTIAVVAAAGFAGALAPGSVLDLGGAADVVAASLLLAVAALLAARSSLLPTHGAPELWVGGAVVLGAGVAVYMEPIPAARTLGAFGLAFIGATGVLLVLHLAGTIGARRAFRASHAGLPRRAPAVALLGVWVAVAFLWAPDTVHQAQTVRTAARPGSLEDAVSDWLDTQSARPVRPERGGPYVPMLLVAASGGGSKAAYWTDLVADCIFGTAAPGDEGAGHECAPDGDAARNYERLFLTSSVSGGSVGVRHLIANAGAMASGRPWVERVAAPEVLSPAVGWGLFHDLPAFMLGVELDPRKCEPEKLWACRRHADRALVQETAAVGGPQVGLDTRRDSGLLRTEGPVAVFNAAEDGAARRLLLARIGLAPAPRRLGCPPPRTGEPVTTAVDAHDVLGPGLDVPLGTAAFVSARFPVVAPPARLGDEDQPDVSDCAAPEHLSPVIARDGGYIENSGALTIAEMLPALERDIALWRMTPAGKAHDVDVRPIVVSIDDDPVKRSEEEAGDDGGDAFGIGKRAGPSFLTTTARSAIESCAFAGVSYFRISPPRRVGAKAATGWEISETTRYEDLGAAISSGKAAAGVKSVRRILAGKATPSGCDWTFPD